MAGNDLTRLPEDLPAPVNDGACEHLRGIDLPDIELPSSNGGSVNLSTQRSPVVVYVFPRIGNPGEPLPDEWDATPGARGCTVQSLVYSHDFATLAELGAVVVGVSCQPVDELTEAASRLKLNQSLLSDERGVLRGALRLPTLSAGGSEYLRRVTFVARDGRVERVWYPVFPPGDETPAVIDWLRRGG
ncbi:MAG: peroxiredoxin [Actinobacteria bacterium]|nr:peroxiredoxin [Actinomycetota bacterium]